MKIIVFLFIVSIAAISQELDNEKSEFGVGAGYVSSPLYIGSSVKKSYVAPFPYIDYRGKYLNINREKIYNNFYDNNNLKIEISASGMLPANSSSNSAREGMPDLDLALDIGPNFIYNIYKDKNSDFTLEMPVRAMFTFGSHIDYNGYLVNMNLHYKKYFNGYKFEYTTGLVWGDRDYHNYYYEVQSQYKTAIREEYHPSSGYGGWQNSLSMTKRSGDFWYGFFIKHYSLSSVVYKDSPLVEQNSALFYGIATSYIF